MAKPSRYAREQINVSRFVRLIAEYLGCLFGQNRRPLALVLLATLAMISAQPSLGRELFMTSVGTPTGTPPSVIGTIGCGNGGVPNTPAVIGDGSTNTFQGYCPISPIPSNWTIPLNFSPNADEAVTQLRFYANSGNAYTDNELQKAAIEIDYLDPATGLPATLTLPQQFIGNTQGAAAPAVFPIIVGGVQQYLYGVTQIRISALDTGSGATGSNPPVNGVSGEAAIREITTTVLPSDPVTVKTLSSASSTVHVGDTVSFRIRVSNAGGAATWPDLQLTDILPAGITFVSATASAGTYNSGTGVWQIGSVRPGVDNAVTLVLTGTVNNTATGTITNTTSAAAGSHHSASTAGDDLSESITVLAVVPPVAGNDSRAGLAIGAPVTVNVLANDTADVNRTLDPASVTIGGSGGPGQPLVVPGQGTWTVNAATGAITFTPQTGFTGDPSPITYTVADDLGTVSNPANVTLDYTSAPVATADSSSGNAVGSVVTLNALANDSADTGRTLNPASVTLSGAAGPGQPLIVPGQGTWSVNTATGAISFTPAPSFTGNPTPISYTVADDQGNVSGSAAVTVDYTIRPVATADSSSGNAIGSVVTLNTLANDSAATGRTLNPASVTLAGTAGPGQPLVVSGQGTWSVNTTTGAVTFTPASGFTGDPTPITYTVADDQGNSSNAASLTVDYTVAPVAADDVSLHNPVGATVTVGVLLNDSAATGHTLDPATITLVGSAGPGLPVTIPGQGTWSVDTVNGQIIFTPDPLLAGNPTPPIRYTVADDQGNVSNVATVTVDYTNAPAAIGDSSLGNPIGSVVTLAVLSNDVADAGRTLDPASVTITGSAGAGQPLTVPGEGTWSVNTATGAISFTPLAGFTGNPTAIAYTVADDQGNISNSATVTVGYTGAPVAANDTSAANPVGSTVSVAVLANDAAGTGRTLDPASVTITGSAGPGQPLAVPGEGTWSVNTATGAISFTPAPGFAGNPTPVSYTVADDQGNISNSATVTISYSVAPVAGNDQSLGNTVGQPVSIGVIANDTAGTGRTLDPSTIFITGAAGPGQPLVVPGEGTWSVNTVAGAITFTPAPGFTGSPTPITYSIKDDQGNVSNNATVNVGYTAPPVANSDSSSGNVLGQPVTLNALANDTVAAGRTLDPASVTLAGSSGPGASLVVPGEGTWSVNTSTGDITFTPLAGFGGSPTPITYTVSDDQGNRSNAATATILYIGAPGAVNDQSTGHPAGSIVTVTALANDVAQTGRTLVPATVTITGTAGPGQPLVVAGQGTWSVNTGTGDITFTPAPGFAGSPTPITYTVEDDVGVVSNPATVSIGYVAPSLSLTVTPGPVTDTNGNGITDPGDILTFVFTVTNTGSTNLSGVTIATTSLPMPGLVCTPVSLAPGQTVTLSCSGASYQVQGSNAGSQIVLNATATGSNGFGISVSAAAAATVPITTSSMTIEKTAGVKSVRQGQSVPYTIAVTNPSGSVGATVNVTDVLPTGLVYRQGTSIVGGTAAEPTVSNQRLTWLSVVVPAGQTVQITLSATVLPSAQPGPLTNRAFVTNAVTGARLSADATATVMLDADPVFDCGTVIGQVFNDINHDGYMNPPMGDQSTVAGLVRSENGLAGVRLVTVRGTFITTDEFGRFHVPCADLPRDIGSNYLLKLDERTLPRGYRMTTENPRVVRLTAGKMTEMNFGATLSRIVRLDISDAAFVGGEPTEALRKGLAGLVAKIGDTPSTLRITYVAGQDGKKVARQRIRIIEKLIGRLWAGQGRYLLNIEEKVVAGKAEK